MTHLKQSNIYISNFMYTNTKFDEISQCNNNHIYKTKIVAVDEI